MEPKNSENAADLERRPKEIRAMKELIQKIVEHLVDKPAEVSITEVTGKNVTVYELRVGEGELGKVIGKHGQTARAIRTILNASSAKLHHRAVLEILE